MAFGDVNPAEYQDSRNAYGVHCDTPRAKLPLRTKKGARRGTSDTNTFGRHDERLEAR